MKNVHTLGVDEQKLPIFDKTPGVDEQKLPIFDKTLGVDERKLRDSDKTPGDNCRKSHDSDKTPGVDERKLCDSDKIPGDMASFLMRIEQRTRFFVKIGLQTEVWLWFLFSFLFVFEYKKSLLSKSKLCCDWKRDFQFSLFCMPEVCLSATEPQAY